MTRRYPPSCLPIGSYRDCGYLSLPVALLAVILFIIIFILIVLIQPAQHGPCPTRPTSAIASPRAFLFHTVDSVRNVECLFERSETRTAPFPVSRCRKERGVDGTAWDSGGGWRRRRWGCRAPRVREEFVNGIPLCRVDAEKVCYKVLRYE